jgi:hypothetical protein
LRGIKYRFFIKTNSLQQRTEFFKENTWILIPYNNSNGLYIIWNTIINSLQEYSIEISLHRKLAYRRGGVKMLQLHLVVRKQIPQLHNMWRVANAASDTRVQKYFI